MVFIHGESYEWNSGNPYDGSVLAAYGQVIIVTLNFRLGVLGFLKTSTEASSSVNTNFGLVDQTAALIWIRDNIAAFGGNPSSVTVFGHGTGAACASLLMISPMMRNGDQRLFHRAILMSGTALSDWAMAADPAEVTRQIAKAVGCEIDDNISDCLRKRRLDDTMNTRDFSNPFKTRLGPIVDSLVVPNEPKESMTELNDMFKRYELMYGVTEIESIDALDPVALFQGMLEKERDDELQKYFSFRCDKKADLCIDRTLNEYLQSYNSGLEGFQNSDKAIQARDVLLDILSDARTIAPVIQTGRYHSTPNIQSYFYVFTHKSHSKEYIRNKSHHGEELPYVFGVPLGGPTSLFNDTYIEEERLLSEIVMTYFRNFAYTGNPNMPKKEIYETLSPMYWNTFEEEWPEFDPNSEKYIELDIPTKVGEHYRARQIKYWNEIFPQVLQGRAYIEPEIPSSFSSSSPPIVALTPRSNFSRSLPPWILYPPTDDFDERPTRRPVEETVYGREKIYGPSRPSNIVDNVYGTLLETPAEEVKQDSTMSIFTVIGVVFLMANLILFLVIYLKCYRNKKNGAPKNERVAPEGEKTQPDEEAFLMNGCNIVTMMSKSSKSEDTYEATKSGTTGYKLSREISGSTIDAHTKVRDWIAQEIINKYSPRFFRRPERSDRPKQPLPNEAKVSKEPDGSSTLDRSPTRPVSPVIPREIPKPVVRGLPVPKSKFKPVKVSVAVDATPAGRGPSVLMQQPIELTKSLDCPNLKPCIDVPLRRSITLEDFSPRILDKEEDKEMRKSITNINLERDALEPTVIKIDHKHSRSDPVQDVDYSAMKRLKTFDPNGDINVTSKDDKVIPRRPLSPEESLQIIKRRNFPKVLPDHPGKEAMMSKRRSMPAHGLFLPIPESSSFSQPNSPMGNSCTKLPPTPPPRSSTLTRQNSTSKPVFISEPTLSEEPVDDQETVCSSLFVGPIVPGNKPATKVNEISPQSLYEALKKSREAETEGNNKTVIPNPNVRRADPKVVVRPTLCKKPSDDKINRHIPRVVVPDNQPLLQRQSSVDELKVKSENSQEPKDKKIDVNNEPTYGPSPKVIRPVKKSQIPTLVKSSNSSLNKESSSESPSDNSDTGTVVKLIGLENKL